MKKVEPGSITTLYIGPVEITINASTRITKTYYSAGAQMVAMRVVTSTGGNTLYYLHSDHLGSTSLSTCDSGGCGTAGSLIPGSRQSYYPFGAVRTAASSLPTDITFTGQRSDASTGLMFYNARYYDPVIGRFVSADTIVPNAGNPQAFNRFSYVLNNPLRYTDPTGHREEGCGPYGQDCTTRSSTPSGLEALAQLADSYANPAGTGSTEWIESVTASSDEWLDEYRYAPNSDHYYHYCRHQNVWGFGCPGLNTVMDLTYMGVVPAQSGPGISILMAQPGKGASNEEEPSSSAGAATAGAYGLNPETSPATSPYKRPSYSVTPAQRRAVQGQPCVTCGRITGSQIADHIEPLVVEYYKTGTIDIQRMRSVDAVQSQCPTCSNQQGAMLAQLARFMRQMIFGK